MICLGGFELRVSVCHELELRASHLHSSVITHNKGVTNSLAGR